MTDEAQTAPTKLPTSLGQSLLAVAIRLFVIWSGVSGILQLSAIHIYPSSADVLAMLAPLTPFLVIFVVTLIVLWSYPLLIARKLMPDTAATVSSTMTYSKWLRLGIVVMGFWFTASAIAPLLHTITMMLIVTPNDPEHSAALRPAVLYHMTGLAVGLAMIFGAKRLTRSNMFEHG